MKQKDKTGLQTMADVARSMNSILTTVQKLMSINKQLGKQNAKRSKSRGDSR